MRGIQGVFERLPGGVDVLRVARAQTCDGGALERARDLLDRFEVARTSSREARLDHVHAQPLQRAGDLQLFRERHAAAGGLFAVAQRGIEEFDLFFSFHGDQGGLILLWTIFRPCRPIGPARLALLSPVTRFRTGSKRVARPDKRVLGHVQALSLPGMCRSRSRSPSWISAIAPAVAARRNMADGRARVAPENLASVMSATPPPPAPCPRSRRLARASPACRGRPSGPRSG